MILGSVTVTENVKVHPREIGVSEENPLRPDVCLFVVDAFADAHHNIQLQDYSVP